MTDPLPALRQSAARLQRVIEPLTVEELDAPAYPAQWTIGEVISHLGSGAVIMRARIESTVSGAPQADDFNQSVWDEWNAKPNVERRVEAVAADRALIDTFNGVTDAQRAAFQLTLGPMTVDLNGLAGLRLNEHAVHTWDIEVVLDPEATIAADATELVVDNLETLARYSGKADGVERVVTIATTSPPRRMRITTTADSVSLQPAGSDGPTDVELPAEAFIRLVYGRLDPAHTPTGLESDATLAVLRTIFKGI